MSNQKILSIKNLYKSFGQKVVHQGVNIDLMEHEILALFGGSGTGKSLILRSMIGLETPDSGSISFQNREILGLSEPEWIDVRKNIAYVFQNGALFDSLTVYENLAYPLIEHTKLSPSEIQNKITQMLEQVDMRGSENLLPAELSGGMQKRAGLARAIILEPKVILFDEPTAGLDPVNTLRLTKNILKLKSRGMTGIFVTHDIPAALQIADRIGILSQGKIALCLSRDEFIQSDDPLVRSFLNPFEEVLQLK